MDVQDVGEEYSQSLLQQKQVLYKARIRKGHRPQDWKPREEVYISFMMAIMATSMRRQDNYMIHTSFVPPSYLPCNTSLAELRSIHIEDLQLETHHRGTYLMVRAITPPNRMTGILVLVEDESGHVVVLQIYQQEDEGTRSANDIVDVGTVLILKEPFLKVMASGEYGLRVDHLCDILVIDEHDYRRPSKWRPRVLAADRSVESLKKNGNEAISAGRPWKAITQYTAAMLQKPTNDQTDILRRNRALAYLKTKQFDAALIDTNFPVFGLQPSEKSLFRAAEALYGLRRFEEARQVLETLTDSFPGNTRARDVLEHARNRCLEQSTGQYNFRRLQAAARKCRPPQLDHATYIGPIEVREVTNKGRGLFVTQRVRAGDLLLFEKAFSHAWVDEQDNSHSKSTLLLNIETGRGFAGGQAELIKMTVQKLYNNPSLAGGFCNLYHGDYKPVEDLTVDGQPIVDTFLVERIMSYNVFGCPLSSYDTYKNFLADTSKKPTAFGSCGIWTQASFINHSCTSNVRRSFIGDMMIVRASQDLEAGTELTFWYQSPVGMSFKKLSKKLDSWGFVCMCVMCNDARETKAGIRTEREKLQEQLKQLCTTLQSRNSSITKYERLLVALDATYTHPAVDVPRLLLWDPQLLLVRIYNSSGTYVKSLEWIGRILRALGFVVVGAGLSSTPFEVKRWGLMIDHLVEVFVHAQSAFITLGHLEDSKRAADYARVAYKIVVGEDSSFEHVHRS